MLCVGWRRRGGVGGSCHRVIPLDTYQVASACYLSGNRPRMTMTKCFISLLRLYKHYLVVWWKLRRWKQGVSQSALNTEASPPSLVCQYGWNFVPWFYVLQYLTLFTPPPNLCLEQTVVCSNALFPDMDIYWYLLGFVLQFYIGKKNLLKIWLYKGVNAKCGMLKETR